MPDSTTNRELEERLNLIESMIVQGRRTTERWGWTFVLWGVAYLAASAWSAWGPMRNLAWIVTMAAAALFMWIKISFAEKHADNSHPDTTAGRAIFSVWVSMAVAMVLLLVSLSLSGRADTHIFIAVVGAMLGVANAASSMILRWKVQFGCAVVWWTAGATACFASDTVTIGAFVGAIFLCQIVFGIYCMLQEGHARRAHDAIHG